MYFYKFFNVIQRIGQGVLFYNYGAFYRGQWQDDLKHGAGVMENKDGTSYDGEWEHNQASLFIFLYF